MLTHGSEKKAGTITTSLFSLSLSLPLSHPSLSHTHTITHTHTSRRVGRGRARVPPTDHSPHTRSTPTTSGGNFEREEQREGGGHKGGGAWNGKEWGGAGTLFLRGSSARPLPMGIAITPPPGSCGCDGEQKIGRSVWVEPVSGAAVESVRVGHRSVWGAGQCGAQQ